MSFANLLNIPIASVLLLFTAGCGAQIFKRLKTDFSSTLEEFLFSTGLGFGLISLLTLVAGAAKLYYPLTAHLLAFAIAVVGTPKALYFGQQLLNKLKKGKLQRPPLITILIGLPTVLTLVVILLASASPPLGFDTLVYHFGVPEIFIREHRIIYTPNILHSHYPPFAEMTYLFAMLLHSDILAQLITTTFSFLTLLAMYHLAKNLFDKKIAKLSIAVLTGVYLFAFVSTTAYIEPQRMFYTTLALLAFFNWKKSNKHIWLCLLGLNLGFLVACKITDVAALMIFTPLVFLEKRSFKDTLTICVVAALAALSWYLKTWIYTGNPVWPYFYTILGGKNWDLAHAELWRISGSSVNLKRDLQNLIAAPIDMTFHPNRLGTETRLGPLFLAFLPLLPFSKKLRRNTNLQTLLKIAVSFFVIWAMVFPRTRYLMPVFPIFAIATALIINELSKKGRLLKFVSCSALVLSLGINLTYETILDKPKISAALGRHSREDFYRSNNYLLYDNYDYINKTLPKEAKILVCHNRTYGLQRDYFTFMGKNQTVINFLQLDSKEKLLNRLKELKITHIVAAPPEPEIAEGEYAPSETTPKEKRGLLTQKLAFLDLPLELIPQPLKNYFNSADYQTVAKKRYNWEEAALQNLDKILLEDTDEIFNANQWSVWKIR